MKRGSFLKQVGTTLAAGLGIAFLPAAARAGNGSGKPGVNPDTTDITYNCCLDSGCGECTGSFNYRCIPSQPGCPTYCTGCTTWRDNCYSYTEPAC